MMNQFIISVIIFTFTKHAESMTTKDMKLTDVNMTAHLGLSHIQKICKNKDLICKLNHTRVCTIRNINGTYEYEEFQNSCYLFLSNMCDNPGKEFFIVAGESCESFLKIRRHYEESGITVPETATSKLNTTRKAGNTTKPSLREFSFSPLYKDEYQAVDYHMCPYSCPNVYKPVCMSANRGNGKYLKFYQFVNHCEADLYSCKHPEELEPPPDRDQEVVITGLGFSFCGHKKHVDFTMVSQVISSMGHYGWLEGDQRFTKLLEPYERKPGYG